MSQVVPHAVVTGRKGNKSTNFLIPQMSSVICSASFLEPCLTVTPTWHQEAAPASQQRPGFSLTIPGIQMPWIQRNVWWPKTLMLTSESNPGNNPLASECLVLRFLINYMCLEGKLSKGKSERDHFDFEVGKNKDNSLQNVEISSHFKETFVLCPL